jgi:hypothetical protein
MPGGVELLAKGSFTSDGVSQNIQLPSPPDLFEVFNLTKFGSTAASTPMMRAKWFDGLAQDSAYVDYKTNGAATIQITTMESTGGFSLLDTSDDTPGALNSTGTAVTAASPPVVSATSTSGLLNGDIVRMINVTNMQQISSMEFTIGSLVTNTSFELSYLDASGFAAAGTTCSFRKIPFDPIYYPARRYITKITKAAQAVITLSVTHGYTVGQKVRFIVPDVFGMIEMDGLLGEITAVNTTNNTITVNINSSGFNTFAFPASGDVPFTFAQVVPVGDNSLILDGATDNISSYLIQCGANVVGAASDVIQWYAYKYVTI